MASSSKFFNTIFSTVLILALIASVQADDARGRTWMPMKPAACQGSLAECMAASDDFEMAMDSEINRRILATSDYISYGALQRNTVPCSQRGGSYYNCRPGAQANPYARGCSAITRCRS